MRSVTCLLAATLCALAVPGTLLAGEVQILCTQALTAAMGDLGPAFERSTGHHVAAVYGTTGNLVQRAESGEQADVVVVTRVALDGLASRGVVLRSCPASVPGPEPQICFADIARSRVGLAVRLGAPVPDIRTAEGLKQTLLASPSVAYPDPADGGISGIAFARVLRDLGIADAIAPGATLVRNGGIVGELAAAGRVRFAVQMVGELLPVPGIQVVGPLPDELKAEAVFAAAVDATAGNVRAAAAWIRFLKSDAAAPILSRHGLEPM